MNRTKIEDEAIQSNHKQKPFAIGLLILSIFFFSDFSCSLDRNEKGCFYLFILFLVYYNKSKQFN